MKTTEANDQLNKILKTIKPDWDGEGYASIIEIEKAIGSKYLDKKMYVINKYKTKG